MIDKNQQNSGIRATDYVVGKMRSKERAIALRRINR